MAQIKVNVLKEEKRLLLEQVKALSRGEERPPLMLPPSLEADLTDLSEDELEGRLASLRGVPSRRRRSESREYLTPSPLCMTLHVYAPLLSAFFPLSYTPLSPSTPFLQP